MPHAEVHRSQHGNWLRAAVLGANDGLISTSSLVVGVASAGQSSSAIILAAFAGLTAGALSMAAGEYVSVSSQSDADTADLKREGAELEAQPAREAEELTHIYLSRGVDRALASQVSEQLMAHDALDAHARDELGIVERRRPRAVQAAITSAGAFALGALPPVLAAGMLEGGNLMYAVVGGTAVLLVVLGATAAHLGGASRTRGALRVLTWGLVAMAITAAVGGLFGVAG